MPPRACASCARQVSTRASTPLRQYFGKMQRPFVAELQDLLAATEPVGHDDRRRSGAFDGGQKPLAGDGLRDLEFVRFKTERSGHAAAARLDGFDRRACLPQQRNFLLRPAEDRLVMAVAVDEDMRAFEA